MAPKRARLSRGSSSSRAQPTPPPEYDTTRFTSLPAQEEYERLRTKSVAKERGFSPVSRHGELLAMIWERGWTQFCEAPSAVPLSIVREFYANAKAAMNGISWVRGVEIVYTAEAIRDLLQLPARPEGVEDWTFKARSEVDLDEIVAVFCVPGTDWKRRPGSAEPLTFAASALNRYARAWNLFVCANLLPSSHSHEVTVERAILLWAICNDQYIDVGYHIYQNILRFMRSNTSGAIPHAWIITQLCERAGVQWGLQEQLQQPMAVIDTVVIDRLAEWNGGAPHERGLGYVIQEAGGSRRSTRTPTAAVAGSDSPVPSGSDGAGSSFAQMGINPSQMSSAEFRRAVRRIEASHEMSRRHAEALTDFLQQRLGEMGFDDPVPRFGAGLPAFPPPDSPPEEGGSA